MLYLYYLYFMETSYIPFMLVSNQCYCSYTSCKFYHTVTVKVLFIDITVNVKVIFIDLTVIYRLYLYLPYCNCQGYTHAVMVKVKSIN